MADFFQFEADFIEELRCIPMQVRLKLDTCGVKLKLTHWHNFSQQERQLVLDLPCTTPGEITAYKQFLQSLVTEKTGAPAKELAVESNPPWLNGEIIPQQVEEKAEELGVKLTVKQWGSLTALQRFALIKLSRPSHENRNFYPALQEFGLVISY